MYPDFEPNHELYGAQYLYTDLGLESKLTCKLGSAQVDLAGCGSGQQEIERTIFRCGTSVFNKSLFIQ